MDLEGLYKNRIQLRNAVSSKRLELRGLELDLEIIEMHIEEQENKNGQKS